MDLLETQFCQNQRELSLKNRSGGSGAEEARAWNSKSQEQNFASKEWTCNEGGKYLYYK